MRLVVKVGTSTIAYPTGHLNIRRVEMLCKVLSDIANAGNDVILVSSGAIGVGAGKLGMMGRPPDMPTKQAAAAIGQSELMYEYDKIFSEYNHTVAQILLTAEDVEEPQRCANFRSTIFRLLELHAIPIINENDTVATAEIALGDNDTLGAIVASVIRADLLVLMSDIDGLYSADPNLHPDARFIAEVEEITPEIEALAGGTEYKFGTGGMRTKVHAAHIATEHGTDMVIMSGRHPDLLYDLLEGKPVGTRFFAKKENDTL